MKRFRLICAALVLAAFTTFTALGGDTNAAGIWKWSLAGQNGETILKLKQDGEKLSGSYTNQFGQAEITDGSLKDGDIAFKVKREFNGQDFLIKYSGRLSGDKITGKCEFDISGETRALKWEAKRQIIEFAPAAAASGNWNTALILGDGNRIEGTLKLKQNGDKLTGATVRNDNETEIQDGKIAGGEITFKVIRERDGRKVTGKYKGQITGDTIKGKVESDWSGDWQTLDWEGTRGK
ncbi:MAG TPA: hypothetical protein VK633_04105 [Verrucomicrobiae bacterium]|nr:hypothetical protein [Verrucomicrobiae bacterium]